ncbi:peptidoglycan binding protein CsiV [Candidatus Enterovibrio altilux]|uniref:Uncharacterized protein n=1 Tax=Candidatus Enterovibrio altilux TaxID=1927128 RepID=A0A291B6G9_9GAMM|nr:peptidoglycan binding protein CsiV [Candidatus Enterovibrio luxaltus]ATF08593.1 hypothetical protein BTN50_0046 [Candidatus Enterovibrio luxaltus]
MKKLIVLLLYTISWSSLAERIYDVEVIVFKRNQNSDTIKENWQEELNNNDFFNAISVLDSVTLSSRDIKLLPKSDCKLNEEYNLLSRHVDFKPLLHVAWRQNDGSKSIMPKLRFTAGIKYDNDFYTNETSEDVQGYSHALSLNGDSNITKQNGSMYELDGFIRVYVEHYLFIETDLILREPGERKVLDDISATPASILKQPNTPAKNITQDGTTMIKNTENVNSSDVKFTKTQQLKRTYTIEKYLQSYTFKQKRRMKSGEIHYLDHPFMGLIIQVTRANLNMINY